ncbi:MAG: hypothetical protein AB3N33_00830 [Puniceicoccaceae bacterium]
MKYYNALPLFLSAFAMAPFLTAEWTLVEDYEDGTFPDGYTNINTVDDASGQGGNFIVEDPLDSNNKVNKIVADTGEIIYSHNFNVAVFPLPTPIAEGSVATFYLRHMKEGFLHDVVWGLTGFPPPRAASGGYYLFEEMTVAMQYSSRFNYDPRSGLYYMGIDGSGSNYIWSPDLNTYYHTWTVIDLAANTYDIYIQGGVYTEPTMVIENVAFKQAPFPGADTNPLTHMFVFAIEGAPDNPRGVDPFYIDDIYIDYTGSNLTIPSSGTSNDWYGYPIAELNWVDTDSWLSWVNITFDPWVYVDGLGKYVYLQDDSGWTYVPRPAN